MIVGHKYVKPQRGYWAALSKPKPCPQCGYELNGSFYIHELLKAPVECRCNKCEHEWSIAIPLGNCNQRIRIELLLESEERHHQLSIELEKLNNRLHDIIPEKENEVFFGKEYEKYLISKRAED